MSFIPHSSFIIHRFILIPFWLLDSDYCILPFRMTADSAQHSYEENIPTVLAPLSCKACSAPLVVADTETVRCPHCGETNEVPEGYRALLIARTAPDALRKAEREWLRFKRVTLSPTVAMIAGSLPAVIFVIGLLAALVRGISNPNTSIGTAEFVGRFVLLPLIPALALSFFALSLSIRRRHVPSLRLSLAARPPATPHDAPGCRQCGAQLHFAEGALFAKCIYCETESLVTTDALHARALVREVEALQSSALLAINAYRGRVSRAILRSSWRVIFLAIFLVLPFLWAFGGPRYQVERWVNFALFSVLMFGLSSVLTTFSIIQNFSDGSNKVEIEPDEREKKSRLFKVSSGLFYGGLFFGPIIIGVLFIFVSYRNLDRFDVKALRRSEESRERAARFEKSCEAGDASICYFLARMYDKGEEIPKDRKRAAEFYDKACAGGATGGCYYVAEMYETGEVVPKSLERAAALYSKSCEAFDADGCNNLGLLYEEGKGVPLDLNRAMTLYKKACDNKSHHGCYNLARMYDEGSGTPANKEAAANLYSTLCDENYPAACNNLAIMYEDGDGVTKNAEKAIALFTKACDSEDGLACFNLAKRFESGGGVARDAARAAELYKRACALGYKQGCEH